MKKFLMTLSLLLTLGLSTAGVAAQTDGVQAPDLEGFEDAFDVEGLESVYDRTFSVDFEAMMASPDSDAGEMDFSAMMNIISIQGITFDSEDNAEAYINDMLDQMDEAMEEQDAAAFEDMEVQDLEGFDVDGVRVDMSMPDLDIAASMIIFNDDNHVFQVMVMNADADVAKASADEVAQYVIDAEVQTEEVTFSDDGTSTGGVFDRMPTSEDELVGDLTTVLDSEIHVAGAE